MMLRAFIQEKPIFKDYFTTNNNATLNKLQAISKKDEWISIAERYKANHYIEQAAAFYSAYALVNDDQDSYKKAIRLWALGSKPNNILVNACMEKTTLYGYKDGYGLEAHGWFPEIFDLEPLSLFPIQDFSITNSHIKGSYNAWDVSPNAHNNGNKEPKVEFNIPKELESPKQVMINYLDNYRSNSLWDTEAGYYAVQLAIWGRIKGYDPAGLTIKTQTELATKVRNLASSLYNDYSEVSYSVNLYYNDSEIAESYNLSENGEDGYVTLFYDNGTWYYSSERMKITTNGYPGDVEWTVTVNGEGYVADGTGDNSEKKKTITKKAYEDSAFYFYLPYGTTAAESSISVSIKYNYIDAMLLDYSKAYDDQAQKMIMPNISTAIKKYSIKFIRDAKEKSKKK